MVRPSSPSVASASPKRAQLKQPAEDERWVADDDSPVCQNPKCAVRFTTFTRRHHCRNCGFLFCFACTNHTHTIPDLGYYKPVRVCRWCKEELQRAEIEAIVESADGVSDAARLSDVKCISAPFHLQLFNHPKLRYIRIVQKMAVHKRRGTQKRVLCIVDQFLVLSSLTGRVRRVVRLEDITAVYVQDVVSTVAAWRRDPKTTNHIVFKVKDEIDIFVRQSNDSRNAPGVDDSTLISTVQYIHRAQTGRMLPARQVQQQNDIRDYANFANYLTDEAAARRGESGKFGSELVGKKFGEVMQILVGEGATGDAGFLNESFSLDNITKKAMALAKEGGKEIMANVPFRRRGSQGQLEHPAVEEMRELLQKYAPLRLRTLPALLKRFKDREDALLHELKLQYEPETATRAMIVELISKYDPDRVEHVEELLADHRQNETELLERLQEHYAKQYFPEEYQRIKREEGVTEEDEAGGQRSKRPRGLSTTGQAELHRCLSRERAAEGGERSLADLSAMQRRSMVATAFHRAKAGKRMTTRLATALGGLGLTDEEVAQLAQQDPAQPPAGAGEAPPTPTAGAGGPRRLSLGTAVPCESSGASSALSVPPPQPSESGSTQTGQAVRSPDAAPAQPQLGAPPGGAGGLQPAELCAVLAAEGGLEALRLLLREAPDEACGLPALLAASGGDGRAVLRALRRRFAADPTPEEAAAEPPAPRPRPELCDAATEAAPRVVPGAIVWLTAEGVEGVPPGTRGVVSRCSGDSVTVEWPGAPEWQGALRDVSPDPPLPSEMLQLLAAEARAAEGPPGGAVDCGGLLVAPAAPAPGPPRRRGAAGAAGVGISLSGARIAGVAMRAVCRRTPRGDIRVDFPEVGECITVRAADESRLRALFARCGVRSDLPDLTRDGGVQCSSPRGGLGMRQLSACAARIAREARAALLRRSFARLREWAAARAAQRAKLLALEPASPAGRRAQGRGLSVSPQRRPGERLAAATGSPRSRPCPPNPSPDPAPPPPQPARSATTFRRHPALPPEARGRRGGAPPPCALPGEGPPLRLAVYAALRGRSGAAVVPPCGASGAETASFAWSRAPSAAGASPSPCRSNSAAPPPAPGSERRRYARSRAGAFPATGFISGGRHV
eukprot:TRINITY_DN24029_c0_g1_i1.p1 TRINITY_DN24029_c0_g1~~TRINITY_DN24029_c0_g1_i1.p1  ORF type:complete len:1129 (+),score=350.96 TRINITY_DN24029_c0_g1_i1:80-3466(+)